MFYGNIPPLCPCIPLFWGCAAWAWAASLGCVYSCGELMRENCLQDRSERHHVLHPVRRLHPSLFCWLCGLISKCSRPGASADPHVPNRSRTINNSPISCGGLGSDVGRRTSVQGRLRTSQPGSVALVRCHGQTGFARWVLPDLVNMDGMMIWDHMAVCGGCWSGWAHLWAFAFSCSRYFFHIAML